MSKFKTTLAMINIFIAVILIFVTSSLYSQELKKVTDGKYTYEEVENDPLKARIYTLDNGLKVFLSVNKVEPKIQTYIVVGSGSKNDPPTSQGLSHYLEHMLFKGTDKFGTKNFEAEKPLIDSIIALYEQRRLATDPDERKLIYKKIDSISYVASEYAIANEYDKMIADIGGDGSNAWTSLEETVYTCNIPTNQLERWLTLEAERFRNPVMRLFHTELEAVYEEKNTTLDDDNDKVWQAIMEGLFPSHTYGTQTTIGSVEQLQNPSVQAIIDFYNENYVTNNMAICLSGDLDPEKTIELINNTFGKFESKPDPEFVSPVQDPINGPVIKEVVGPSEESVMFGYRNMGADTKDADILTMMEYILSNGSAGLIDLNLNQDQKVIDAYCGTYNNKDYSLMYLGGKPREGQSLDQVKDLLLQQLELVKKGEFPEWLIEATINNFKKNQLQSYEKNSSRGYSFLKSFILDIPWNKYIFNVDRLSKITKDDIVKFANENLNTNYVIVYKRTGEDKSIVKVDKPEINPVKINRDDKSDFIKEISNMSYEEIQPEFADYDKDITKLSLNNNIPLFYVENKENDLFYLNFISEVGTNQNKKIALATAFFDYIATSKYSSSELKEKFYRLASSYSVSVSEDQLSVSLSGLNENFDESLKLLEEIISDPKVSSEALTNLKSDINKEREDAKLDKGTILWSGLYNYGKFGKDNPFTYRLSKEELNSVTGEEITEIIKDMFSFKQRAYYYGPLGNSEIISSLNEDHKTPSELKTLKTLNKFKEEETEENIVYVVNYDMQQAEIVFISKKRPFDLGIVPIASMYNEYFGGGMGSVVYQEIRESKALAYSTFSVFQMPKKNNYSHYNIAYIGTQADKLPEAMAGMTDLLENFPASEVAFNNAKSTLIKQIQSERTSPKGLLGEYENNLQLGITENIDKKIYENIDKFTLNDIVTFQKQNVKDSKYTILVLADTKKIDMKVLEKYGKVKVLTIKDVFGY